MTIRSRKLASGKTVYDVTVAHDGIREYVTAYSRSEARALEIELKAKYSRCNARRHTMTLDEYIYSIYWPVASKRLSATSLDTYEKEIRLRIAPTLGEKKLKEIDRPTIQRLMVDGCATECVARKAIGVLKTILNEAINDGYIDKNYACSKFAMPKGKNQRDNGLVLASFDDIYSMLDYLDEHATICLRRIAYTGLLQGLRPEERYALEWSCFDLGNQTITVKEARVSASSKHGGVQDKATKTTHSKRVIPMHPRFYEFLTATPSTRKGAYIIGGDGGKISPSTAQKRWRSFLKANPRCPQVTIENMRHSFATSYLAAGGRIEVLSRILGHSNISTTISRYYRPDVELIRGDMAKIL